LGQRARAGKKIMADRWGLSGDVRNASVEEGLAIGKMVINGRNGDVGHGRNVGVTRGQHALFCMKRCGGIEDAPSGVRAGRGPSILSIRPRCHRKFEYIANSIK